MEEGWCSMAWQVHLVVVSALEYQFPELWYLSRDNGLVDIDLRFDFARYGPDSSDRVEEAEHGNHNLLHFDRYLVFRSGFLLHVQRS